MGLCCSSSARQIKYSASTSEIISSGAGNSSYTTSSGSSNVTGNSRGSGISNFSAASGEDIFSNGHIYPTPSLRVFSFNELKNATRNFKPDTWIGEGGFGKVYKGWIDGRNDRRNLVAIKKLYSESFQGYEEWQAEIDFLGRLSHPNLVKLIGYCYEEKELLLVYEYMPKGSLENHLFGRGSAVQPLAWDLRLKIALGAARAIAFLHTSEKQVIYRDFKSSNILLDGNYTAKVSDFGLAKLGPSDSRSHVTTRVMGTYGYAAPEYVTTGHLYVKSDVYGYGIVLMEILTGLRALDLTRPTGKQQLVDWIKPYLADRRRLKSVMDCRLGGKYPSKEAHQVARLALSCAEKEPKNRPSMKQVVETLEQIEGGGRENQAKSLYPLPSARRTISDLSSSTDPN